MKNKLLFLLFVVILSPIIANADVTKILEVDFAFSRPVYEEQQLLGYRLYKEGTKVCETNDPAASKINCNISTQVGTFNFTLTAYYSNGGESPHSPSFPFAISSTPTTPPDSTGTKKISYSIDNNNTTGDRAGYRMYMNETLLCATANANATSLNCTADLINDPMAFSVTTLDSKGIESQKSNILLLDPSTLPINTSPTPDALLAVIKPIPASGKVPLTVSFAGTDSTGDIASYSWEFGDGSTATGSLVSHNYSVAGTYTATLHVADNNGATHQVSTTITALPSSATAQPPTAVVSSSTAAGNAPLVVNFDGSGSTTPNLSIVTYSWTFGDGSSATGKTTSHSFTTAGTYYTQLTVEDNKGLTNTISTPIIVIGSAEPNKKPFALISSSLPGGDAPIIVTFDGSKSSDPDGSITAYSWNFGDGTTGIGPVTQHTYTNKGIYTVSLQVTDDKGDTATATSKIACNTTLPAPEFNIEVGEVSINQNWVKVLFENTFDQPIVVAGPPTSNEKEPVLVRIRNIDKEGFEARLQEWDYQNGNHAQETFSYIVMEKGTFTLTNGTKIEAGNFTGSNSLQKLSLQQSYNLTPVILTQVITENETDAVTGRVANVSQASFDFMLQEQEKTKTLHTTETIDYIAWETGKGELVNMVYEAGTTTESITQTWSDLVFENKFNELPLFIAGMQTTNSSDTATVRNQNTSQTATQIKIEEELSQDSETSHTTEAVGYLAISAKTTGTELPAPPTASDKKFTFTWEYGDTQNISGFRFYLNGTLLGETTNPDDRQIICYATLPNETMEFTMTAVFLNGTESSRANLLRINPTDYPTLLSNSRLAAFTWDFAQNRESTIQGFKIYNNDNLVCETNNPSVREIACEIEITEMSNSFSIKAVGITGSETEASNALNYKP